MSPHNLTGGVSNLRAIFETRTSEDRSASPPSRGRSPALSDASLHSRPVSKVRASFVVVENPAPTEDGQHWGLRKASDVSRMADVKNEVQNGLPGNGTLETAEPYSLSNGVHKESDSPLQESSNTEAKQNGLGGILKGSPFESSPAKDGSQPHNTPVREPSSSPKTHQEKTTATVSTDTSSPKMTSRTPSQTIGSKIKDALSSGRNQPPRSEKLKTTPTAKPVKPPPTRQMPPTKPSMRSPTSPRTPRTPKTPQTSAASASPKLQKPPTRGSANKPAAVAESAKPAASPGQAKRSPTIHKGAQSTFKHQNGGSAPGTETAEDAAPPALPKSSNPPVIGDSTENTGGPNPTESSPAPARESEPEAADDPAKVTLPDPVKSSPTLSKGKHPVSRTGQSRPAGRSNTTSVQKSGPKREVERPSADLKRRSGQVPAAAAPTASSTARSHGPQDLARRPTVTKRERPPAKTAAPTAPAAKRVSRTSFSTQSGKSEPAKARTSGIQKAPAESFLSRMMRPTTSSAQKAHEKAAPSSPPQARRTAPKPAVEGQMRRSLARSDEDKENSCRGQETEAASATAESKQLEVNRQSGTEAQPLRDITPAPESPSATEEAASQAVEASEG